MTDVGHRHAPIDASADVLNTWLLQRGLEGATQEEVLHGYCSQLVSLGIPLYRLHVAQSAFHPQYGGIGFDWLREEGMSSEEYTYSETPRAE